MNLGVRGCTRNAKWNPECLITDATNGFVLLFCLNLSDCICNYLLNYPNLTGYTVFSWINYFIYKTVCNNEDHITTTTTIKPLLVFQNFLHNDFFFPPKFPHPVFYSVLSETVCASRYDLVEVLIEGTNACKVQLLRYQLLNLNIHFRCNE